MFVLLCSDFLGVELMESGASLDELSPWVLRIVLDDKFINNRVQVDDNFSMADIAAKITVTISLCVEL